MPRVSIVRTSSVPLALVLGLLCGPTTAAAEGAAKPPAECEPQAGAEPVSARVRIDVPHEQIVGGVVVFVGYPADKVLLRGRGVEVGEGVVTDLPAGVTSGTNDLGNGFRQVVAKAGTLTERELFTVRFERCAGGDPPATGDFSCTVEQIRDPGSNPVTDATCTVTLITAPKADATAS